MKKIIVFDMDGTLAESKQQISIDIANLLSQLLDKYFIAIISGGDYPQFEKQVIPFLKGNLEKLTIFPTSGTKMYTYKNKGWDQVYCENLEEDIKKEVIKKINWGIQELGYAPEKQWGDLIEDRGTQVTYSALGQLAPVDAKKQWDPSGNKRKAIQELISGFFPELQINTGGSTSIDITRKGIDKGYGIDKIVSLLGFKKEEILFIGDAIYPGGNDYPPFEMGIDCRKVSGPEQTKKYILELL